jgi:hypothetical protein
MGDVESGNVQLPAAAKTAMLDRPGLKNSVGNDKSGPREAMKSTPRRIATHVIIFVVAIIVITALSIWLDTGAVVFSP